ncbi:hypothetical protein WJX72_001421 [[Myrmecia] bisecta]|uniref:Uncharacterized protein n=1 Tax=[Myrmecia] bisecta TaxID=41462 RepID=A0AAW1PNG9_9CHLO
MDGAGLLSPTQLPFTPGKAQVSAAMTSVGAFVVSVDTPMDMALSSKDHWTSIGKLAAALPSPHGRPSPSNGQCRAGLSGVDVVPDSVEEAAPPARKGYSLLDDLACWSGVVAAAAASVSR